jgi:hypothetical protein
MGGCASCCRCAGLAVTFDDLYNKDGLSENTRKRVGKLNRDFVTTDRRILYFLSFGLLVNFLVVLFVMGSFAPTQQLREFIVAECLFGMMFGLLLYAGRIWLFRFYQYQPMIALWNQLAATTLDKWMFGLFTLFTFAAMIVMAAAVAVLASGNLDLGIVLSCIMIVLLFVAVVFYRLHVAVYIRYAIDHVAIENPNQPNQLNQHQVQHPHPVQPQSPHAILIPPQALSAPHAQPLLQVPRYGAASAPGEGQV